MSFSQKQLAHTEYRDLSKYVLTIYKMTGSTKDFGQMSFGQMPVCQGSVSYFAFLPSGFRLKDVKPNLAAGSCTIKHYGLVVHV